MRLLITLIFIGLLSPSAFSQDNTTKNKAKAMYYTAEALYESGEYTKTIRKIEEMETLLNGIKLATAQNLKVKALIGQGSFLEAQKELDVLYSLNPSGAVFKDIAQYSSKIDDGIEAEKLALERVKLAELKKEERKRELKEKANYATYNGPEGLGKVSENGLVGFVDKDGNIIIPIKYTSFSDSKEDLVTMYKDRMMFLYKKEKLLLMYPSIFLTEYSSNIIGVWESDDDNVGDSLYSIRDKKLFIRDIWDIDKESLHNGVNVKYCKSYEDLNYERYSYINVTKYL